MEDEKTMKALIHRLAGWPVLDAKDLARDCQQELSRAYSFCEDLVNQGILAPLNLPSGNQGRHLYRLRL